MEIYVPDNGLRKAVENQAACRKSFGADMAKKINLRVAAFKAAESLADFWPPKSGPERCHELKGERKGTFSVDLNQPHRLLFQPSDTPAGDVAGEQQRWRSITAIDIVAIEDTHG